MSAIAARSLFTACPVQVARPQSAPLRAARPACFGARKSLVIRSATEGGTKEKETETKKKEGVFGFKLPFGNDDNKEKKAVATKKIKRAPVEATDADKEAALSAKKAKALERIEKKAAVKAANKAIVDAKAAAAAEARLAKRAAFEAARKASMDERMAARAADRQAVADLVKEKGLPEITGYRFGGNVVTAKSLEGGGRKRLPASYYDDKIAGAAKGVEDQQALVDACQATVDSLKTTLKALQSDSTKDGAITRTETKSVLKKQTKELTRAQAQMGLINLELNKFTKLQETAAVKDVQMKQLVSKIDSTVDAKQIVDTVEVKDEETDEVKVVPRNLTKKEKAEVKKQGIISAKLAIEECEKAYVLARGFDLVTGKPKTVDESKAESEAHKENLKALRIKLKEAKSA